MGEIKPSETNFFRIIGKETSETVHSAFLAYLFNPNNILCKEQFLINFLKHCECKYREDDNIQNIIKYIEGCGSEFHNFKTEIEVPVSKEDSENGRKDIIIYNEKIYICIENKIFSEDSKNQLVKYSKDTKKIKADYKLQIFLTPNGSEPVHKENKKENWILAGYEDIKESLENLSNINNNIILKQYIEVIKEDVLDPYNEIVAEIVKELSMKTKSEMKLLSALWRKFSFIKNDKEFILEFGSNTKDRIIYGAGKNGDWIKSDCFDKANENDKCNKNYIYKRFEGEKTTKERYEWLKENKMDAIEHLSKYMEILFS